MYIIKNANELYDTYLSSYTVIRASESDLFHMGCGNSRPEDTGQYFALKSHDIVNFAGMKSIMTKGEVMSAYTHLFYPWTTEMSEGF